MVKSETHAPLKGKSISYEKTLNRYGWLFILLALILLTTFLFYPIIYSLYLSTISSKGIVQKFVGLNNYIRLFNDQMFLIALKNTFTFLVIQVPIMLFWH